MVNKKKKTNNRSITIVALDDVRSAMLYALLQDLNIDSIADLTLGI
jgi:hypothetical protein